MKGEAPPASSPGEAGGATLFPLPEPVSSWRPGGEVKDTAGPQARRSILVSVWWMAHESEPHGLIIQLRAGPDAERHFIPWSAMPSWTRRSALDLSRWAGLDPTPA